MFAVFSNFKISQIILILCSIFSSIASAAYAGITSQTLYNSRPIALVYFGSGVCPGCPDDLATALVNAGFKVKQAFPGRISDVALAEAAVFAVPGGDEERDVMHALAPGEAQSIRQYVQNGGHYLGVCLGAFLAVPELIDTQTAEPGLNLFDGTVTNHSPTKDARMELIFWKNIQRYIYFQDGPEFHLNHPEQADIWAYYQDGSIAAFQESLDAGKVGLIGPHLEATQEWLNEDHISMPSGQQFQPSEDLFRNYMSVLVH
jgi:glutamine amidotransferase-like uncharacterized protein